MKTVLFESISGVAGDMFVSSFVDAGIVSEAELKSVAEKLGFSKASIEIKINSVFRASMQASHLTIRQIDAKWKKILPLQHQHELSPKQAPGKKVYIRAEDGDKHSGVHAHAGEAAHWHAHYRDIAALIEQSALDIKTKKTALKIFAEIAKAEAHSHGTTIEEVAFHEVGMVDSILDVSMAAYCITKLGASKIFATPIRVGRGSIRMAHGVQPVPPPASARLLAGLLTAGVPEGIEAENIELSTPTGIAILKVLSPEFVRGWPAQKKVLCQGMGAGTKDLGAYPNVFRVVVFEGENKAARFDSDEVVEICFNIDDETAEKNGWIAQELLKQRALDVWQVAAFGKKNRLVTVFHMLCTPEQRGFFCEWILTNTSSFGVRYQNWQRSKLYKKIMRRNTKCGVIRYKKGFDANGSFIKEKPEFEDLKTTWTKQKIQKSRKQKT